MIKLNIISIFGFALSCLFLLPNGISIYPVNAADNLREPLTLTPEIPNNYMPKQQKYPPKRKKSVRMRVNENLSIREIRRLVAKELTLACVHNRFNQVRKGLNFVIFDRGDGGVHKLEAASIGDGNLYDPDRRGLHEMLYLFERDATSQCIVYSLPYYQK